jgi:glutathione S-transferase
MLIFYYSKGSSALAAHILLEEVGADYEAQHVALAKQEHMEPGYLAVNPKGRIPALETTDGFLSENPAILTYIAQTHPEAGMLPDTPYEAARVHAFNAYLSSTVHVAFAHFQKGARWSDDPAAIETMRAKVPVNLAEAAKLIEDHYFKGPWVMGDLYTIADPYLFLLHRWMEKAGTEIAPFEKLAAHVAAMRKRPAVQRALEAHEIS